MKDRTQNITQQWVHDKVFKAMKKCLTMRPDLDISIKEMERDEETEMVKVKIHVNNVGKYLFVQKLTYFLCTALMEYAEKD